MDNSDFIEKVKEASKKCDADIICILSTQRAGEIVDNDYGVKFELPKYTVIFLCPEHYKNLFKKYIYDIEESASQLSDFYEVIDYESFLQELKEKESYEIIYQSDIGQILLKSSATLKSIKISSKLVKKYRIEIPLPESAAHLRINKQENMYISDLIDRAIMDNPELRKAINGNIYLDNVNRGDIKISQDKIICHISIKDSLNKDIVEDKNTLSKIQEYDRIKDMIKKIKDLTSEYFCQDTPTKEDTIPQDNDHKKTLEYLNWAIGLIDSYFKETGKIEIADATVWKQAKRHCESFTKEKGEKDGRN